MVFLVNLCYFGPNGLNEAMPESMKLPVWGICVVRVRVVDLDRGVVDAVVDGLVSKRRLGIKMYALFNPRPTWAGSGIRMWEKAKW